MKDLSQIRADIRKIVTDTVESGAIGHVQFFTAKVMADNPEIEGDDADFYIVCAQETVERMVKSAVGKYDSAEEETPLMEGFEHLRKAYPVHRGGDHLLVPVHLCSDEELEARAKEFEVAAKGYVKHALELRSYVLTRQDEQSGQSPMSAI